MPQDTHTKILATIGPSSATREQIEKLIDAGADAFRINFSHGTHEEHKERVKIIRQLEKEKGRFISIPCRYARPKTESRRFQGRQGFAERGADVCLGYESGAGRRQTRDPAA